MGGGFGSVGSGVHRSGWSVKATEPLERFGNTGSACRALAPSRDESLNSMVGSDREELLEGETRPSCI